MYKYNAKITEVVDGDTMTADIDMGFHCHTHVRIRVLNIDTPEKFGDERWYGMLCKVFAEELLLNRDVIIRTVKTDSFGRWLADVFIPCNEDPKGEKLIRYDDICNYVGINKQSVHYSLTKESTLDELREKYYALIKEYPYA